MTQATDYRGRAIPILPAKSVEVITTSGVSQTSAILTTGAIRIVCDQDIFYWVGKNPTASTSTIYLPANVVETVMVEVPGDMQLAVIWGLDVTAGKLNITSMRT